MIICASCNGNGMKISSDPNSRSYIPCECKLDHVVVRSVGILQRLSDGDDAFIMAIGELKKHPYFKEPKA